MKKKWVIGLLLALLVTSVVSAIILALFGYPAVLVFMARIALVIMHIAIAGVVVLIGSGAIIHAMAKGNFIFTIVAENTVKFVVSGQGALLRMLIRSANYTFDDPKSNHPQIIPRKGTSEPPRRRDKFLEWLKSIKWLGGETGWIYRIISRNVSSFEGIRYVSILPQVGVMIFEVTVEEFRPESERAGRSPADWLTWSGTGRKRKVDHLLIKIPWSIVMLAVDFGKDRNIANLGMQILIWIKDPYKFVFEIEAKKHVVEELLHGFLLPRFGKISWVKFVGQTPEKRDALVEEWCQQANPVLLEQVGVQVIEAKVVRVELEKPPMAITNAMTAQEVSRLMAEARITQAEGEAKAIAIAGRARNTVQRELVREIGAAAYGAHRAAEAIETHAGTLVIQGPGGGNQGVGIVLPPS